ncbi:copper chaperone for superoxide dismutase-like [Diorhabda carinulata]|uniref:copper chaperone for superoxide dismutase-like n=1 Tax=Diorhabda carinulata TaxID=1163345 RepID=UPI0025A16FBA|nr:copper chaperone for superoxide dismutase-like [Diorhabda carinulata]
MASTTIEFAVQMTCKNCIDTIKSHFSDVQGVKDIQFYLEQQTVVIQSTLPTLKLLQILESTGKKVAIKGYAGGQAAVSILEAGNESIQGVVRFIQPTSDICIVDGTVDGLKMGTYRSYIYECGDISAGCENVGNIFNPTNSPEGHSYGYLDKIISDDNKRATFRFENNVIKVSDLIGRSFVITEESDNTKKIVCGVIARSAGLFQNPKLICACDGTTVWDEASKKSAL